MTVMDDYLDSPMDADDVFPCKGCGEILEEGKAFELAGNRWHLNCFRCHTCGTLLDSDANLLLLGDGSLICNNCTYSCSACGNKIEDLAILTGDQAFCATCFRCRNCKRKIDNLRYARTSQGIFCMSCHESLMARRRKKSKAAAQTQAKAREKDGSPMITEKSLPALPPNEIPRGAFSNDRVTPESDTPTELSPPPRAPFPRNDSSSRGSSRPDRSPERIPVDRAAESLPSGEVAGLAPPAANYRNNRNSSIILSGDLNSLDGDSFFIPVALDPSPAPSLTPRSTPDTMSEPPKKPKEPEYFSKPPFEKAPEPAVGTPHIAFQEKGRQTSLDLESKPLKPPARKLSKSARPDQNGQAKVPQQADDKSKGANGKTPPGESFKLQEAPKSKKLVSSRSNSQSSVPQSAALGSLGNGTGRKGSMDASSTLQSTDKATTPRSSQDSRFKDDEESPSIDIHPPPRHDGGTPKAIPRKELPQTAATRNGDRSVKENRSDDASNFPPPLSVNGKPISGPLARSRTSEDLTAAGQSTLARPPMPDHKVSDTYMQPRAPPAPPAHTPGKDSISGSSVTESPSPKQSPKLPRWSAGGDFSMDEDMARILGTDEGSSSILRRVSNAVRHGRTNSVESSTTQTRLGHARSVSETTRATASPRWPKTPIAEDPPNGNVAHDISSPMSLSSADDPAFLKRQLRNSEQRVAELERQFSTEKDLKKLNKALMEKRKTVSVLDTQTEIMIRQIEVLAGYVERAKDTKQPIDLRELEDSVVKEFVQKLERVKQQMSAAIEALHAERDELIDDKNKAVADRDRALLEFEQLSSKNAQLADLNNDLTHQIQERFKSHSDPRSPNTLGIYALNKNNSQTNSQTNNQNNSMDSYSIQTGTTAVVTDDEPIVESGPTVVNIRKGQVKKFNWKKGSKTVAQNVAKGVKGAVGAFQQQQERERVPLTGDSIGLPYNMTVAQVDSPLNYGPGPNGMNRAGNDTRQGFGFFKKNTLPKSMSALNLSTPTIAEAPTTLFGSELVERSDYERRQIPSVVTRCIEEVELRGMDVEGIYRKTGGNSQVKMIQDGFEKSEDYDISDPAIDITAVTSVLKQYFRKLPTPLLTYEVYDRILESNAITNEVERGIHLRKTFNMLPQRHRDCLEFLMFHLSRVASREPENLMSPKNLAVVFAPTIMRDHNIEREMTDMHVKNTAVQFVIEHSQTIFSEA